MVLHCTSTSVSHHSKTCTIPLRKSCGFCGPVRSVIRVHTLRTEKLSGDVKGLASHNDNLLAVEELLGHGTGQTTKEVALAINGDLFKDVVLADRVHNKSPLRKPAMARDGCERILREDSRLARSSTSCPASLNNEKTVSKGCRYPQPGDGGGVVDFVVFVV